MIFLEISKKDDLEDNKEDKDIVEFGIDYAENYSGSDDNFIGRRKRRRYYDEEDRGQRSWIRQSQGNYDADEEFGDEYGNDSNELSSFEFPLRHHKMESFKDDEDQYAEKYGDDYFW